MPLNTQEKALLERILEALAAEKTAQEATKFAQESAEDAARYQGMTIALAAKAASEAASEAANEAANKYKATDRLYKAKAIIAQNDLRLKKDELKTAEANFNKKAYDAANKKFEETKKAAKGDANLLRQAQTDLDSAKGQTGYNILVTAQQNVSKAEEKAKLTKKAAAAESIRKETSQPAELTIALKANKEANKTMNSSWSAFKDFVKHPRSESKRRLSSKQRAENTYNKILTKKKRSGFIKALMTGAAAVVGFVSGGPTQALILGALVLVTDKMVEKIQNRDTQQSSPQYNSRQQSDFKSINERQQKQQQIRRQAPQQTVPAAGQGTKLASQPTQAAAFDKSFSNRLVADGSLPDGSQKKR
jgi:hypothetical protein